MILELTKGEIFELMVSALGGFLLLCKCRRRFERPGRRIATA